MQNSSGRAPTTSSRRARTRRRVSTPTPATTAPATKAACGEKHMGVTLTPRDAAHPTAHPGEDPLPNPQRLKGVSWDGSSREVVPVASLLRPEPNPRHEPTEA